MIVDAGYQALPIALVVAVYVAAASFIGAYRGLPALTLSARYGLYTLPLLLGVSTAALVYAFVTDDFSVRYVAENSSLAMPDRYTWVALYAGNSGSLLFIAVAFSAVAAVAAAGLSRKLSFTAPFAIGLMAVVLAFFIGVMVLMANPLDRLAFTPEDGRGINPLLIHFGMFIHPPVQMLGLASVAVPFSIAMGALLAGRGGRDEWVDQGRLWGVLSVARADHRVAAGELVGPTRSSAGRLLGVGPGGELGAHAVAGDDRLRSLDHGAEAPGHVPDVEHRSRHHRLHAGRDGDVHQPGRAGAVGALLRAVDDGVDLPGVHDRDPARLACCIRMEDRHAEEPREAGVYTLPGERVHDAETCCCSRSRS